MALTVSIEGVGIIAYASSTTESIGTGTNQWNEDGAGTDSWTTDTFLQGGECFAGAYSAKSGFQYYHTSTSYDFTTSGNADGQYIWIWVNCPTIGLLQTKSSKGLAIRVGTDLTNYNDYTIAGSDDSNGWLGDWKCFVIDPTKTATATGGSGLTTSNVNYIGVWIDTASIAKGDNIFIDQIAIGTGLRATGTSTTGWLDLVNWCSDTGSFSARAVGSLFDRNGIYYAQGAFYIGDSTQTAATSFVDSGRIITFDTSEYWTGSAWVSTLPTTAAGIYIEDAGTTNTTTFTDGVLVGSDNGRSGSTFLGNNNEDAFFDCSTLTNTGSDINLYSTKFKSFYGGITGEADANHAYYGVTFQDCDQFDPAGAPVIRNCTFAETASTTGALLWNSSIDISNCQFIANTTGEGIEHTTITSVYTGSSTSTGSSTVLTDTGATFTGGNVAVNDYVYNEATGGYAKILSIDSATQVTHETLSTGSWTSGNAYSISPAVTYTNLLFSGNTNDVTNSATGSDALFITKSGTTNASTSTGTVVYLSSVDVTITVKDQAGTVVPTAQVAVFKTSDGLQIMNEDTNASGIATEAYTGTTPVEVTVRVRKASTGATKYINYSSIQNISTSGLTLDVTLRSDPIVN